jgi:L-threonylcarbamoyladenylate synthase
MQGGCVVVDGTIKVIEAMAIISTDIDAAAKLLSQDAVVAIPTETVYGLAGNGFSDAAVRKIFEAKNRPHFNPLILHISNQEMLKDLVTAIPDEAQELMKSFWPGPLTVVLPKSKKVSSLVSGDLPTVAVRIPNHPTTIALLNKIDFPLAAPSANMFGCISPTTALHVENQLGTKIPMILDGGDCNRGLESTIIGFENNQPVLYRLGAISFEEIERVLPNILYSEVHTTKVLAPGMLPYHYSPNAKLFVSDDIQSEADNFKGKNVGVITFSNKLNGIVSAKMKVLSSTRNFEEASKNLYAALHALDELKVDYIFAQKFPDYDLGRTINNRLYKASKKGE